MFRSGTNNSLSRAEKDGQSDFTGQGEFKYFNRELLMVFNLSKFLNTYFKILIPVNGLPPVDNVNFVPDLISSSIIFFLRMFEASCSALSGP